uniref:DNA damage-regulated autophagy modulator protein 2 n=1 Tax=Parascaris univalens TaxID=6257 RepID=A0A914ZNN1_PARUN
FEEICHSEFINTWAHLFTETNITADGTNCVRSKSIFSDSGTLPPESCIFGQLLNLAALFLAVTVYLRHRQIVEFYWHRLKQVGRWRITSCILLWIGYFSAFGVSVVGNFQENNVIIVHYAGALLAFGCGLIYTWAQTVFSYNMNPKLAKPIVSHCRLMLCVISTMFFVTMIVFGPILGKQPNSFVPDAEGHLYKWTVDSPNYREHMIGTCSEWLLAICFQLYILSFAIELRKAYCHAPKLCLMPFCDDPDPITSVFSEKSLTCCGVQIVDSTATEKNTTKIFDSRKGAEAMVVRMKF